ncbi:helix-turn-helix domain-containing protein [Chloroflexota bacterium]
MSELDRGSNAQGGGGRGIARPHHINNNKLCYTVPEAAQLLGFSRNQGYELAKRGEIPIIKLGNRFRVPKILFHEKFGYPPII